MSDSEELQEIPIGEDEGGAIDDLFGDEDVGNRSDLGNGLKDDELVSDKEASGGRDSDDERRSVFVDKVTQTVPMYRHRIPKSNDGSLHSFRLPAFIKIEATEYKADEWEPSRWDMKNASKTNPASTVRYRRDPSTGKMQSNTNMYKWSDGSVTIAIGDEHYEIQSKPMTSPLNKPYQEVQDAHYYAAAAHLTTNTLLIVGHFTEQFTVRPNADVTDEALERLREQLKNSANKGVDEMIIVSKEDPELEKKRAEQAEKERMKAQRRRDTAAGRADGVSGRFKGGGALSLGDLEGRRSGAAGRKRGALGGAKKGRRPDYDTDDEVAPGARKPDNYDMEDGFLVDSEDESEHAEGEDEEDEEDEEDILDDEEHEEEKARKKRRKAAPVVEGNVDGDAHHDVVPRTSTEASGRRRRRIINEEDEDE